MEQATERPPAFTLGKLVKEILERYPNARDSDEALYAKLVEGPPWRENTEAITGFELLTLIEQGHLPNFEMVRRARQRVQEAHEELRGTRYEERQKKGRRRTADLSALRDAEAALDHTILLMQREAGAL